MDKKITVAVIGCGSRGNTYSGCQNRFPDEMKIVAVADIKPERAERFAKLYDVAPDMVFTSGEELLAQPKLADVAFICTMDQQHFGHAIPALKKGYDLLLEKPISPDPAECMEIAKVANELGRTVLVCHVLRYTVFYQQIHDIVASGKIGDVVSIQAIEPVTYWHQAHSFVRGNWRNSDLSSPMILQKCCHDMDLILWISGKKCRAVSSFGSIAHFKPEMAPEGAPSQCSPECPAWEECPYTWDKIYLEDVRKYGSGCGWPTNVLNPEPTIENITEACKTGPYGRCVYHCDNNVVDHQVVNLLLDGGATVNFTMCAFTSGASRRIHVMGTKGDIVGDMGSNIITLGIFGKGTEEIDVRNLTTDFSGHGGGDSRMVHDLLDLVRGKITPETHPGITSIDKSIESHIVAMAAEESRVHGGKLIDIDDYMKILDLNA